MSEALVERLRHADTHSQQRIMGSRIFGEAADRIEALERAVEEPREYQCPAYQQCREESRAEAAEAREARLSGALRGIKQSATQRALDIETARGLLADIDRIARAALSGSNSGWQSRETVPTDDGTIIEVQILEQVQKWNAARFHNAFDGDPRDFRWRFPAAPQPTGGE